MNRRVLRDEPGEIAATAVLPRFHGQVFDVVTERFPFGAAMLTRDVVRHPGAVAILALDDDDRVALIRQYRRPVGRRLWEVPAGMLDQPGEEPLDAAKRELAEEVELMAEHWAPLIDWYTSPGYSDERIRGYRATGITHGAAFAREAEEAELEMAWEPFDSLVDAVLDGGLRSPTLAMLVLAERARRG